MDKIVKAFQYLNRESIDIKHRLVNIVLITGIVAQIPIILCNKLIINDNTSNTILIAVIALLIFFLCLTNKYDDSKVPIVLLLIVMDGVVFPSLYFTSGGRASGTFIWMVFGALAIWILIDDHMKYILMFADVLVITMCMCIEEEYPEYVRFLDSGKEEIVDIMVSLVFVVFLIGYFIHYEIVLYENKTKELIEKEASIAKARDELAQLNEELKRASAAKSNFLANMSHEIRTPINAILGMDEMILRECYDDNILAYANDIDSAGHQLLSLVNDILDFSKIESGKLEIHPVEYDLFSVMNDCYNMILLRAKKKQLQILVENDVTLPCMLVGDEVRIRQIIMNLLTNAVKYTKDGYVKFSLQYEKVTEDDINLIIEIKDTGIGIPVDSLEDLFSAFTRIDETSNRNIEGTGLGLSIVKRFIEMMDGNITVDSVVNEGSTFRASIPQRIANAAEMGEFAQKYRHKEYLGDDPYKVKESRKLDGDYKLTAKIGDKQIDGGSKLKAPKQEKGKSSFIAEKARVLVVDDVKMNLNVVRLLLKGTLMEIDLASSGEEALKYTMMKHYDVILMDHMMPNMDGIETFHNIQKQEMGLNTNTTVIVLTANAIQDAKDMYMNEGFASYITKPVKADALEAELLKYLPKEKVQMNEQ